VNFVPSAIGAPGAAYLDASAVVSLYVRERHTERMRQAIEELQGAATSRIAYAEARAVFARMRRERVLSPRAYTATVALFNNEWERFSLVDITDPLVRSAADLAERHPLLGFDALHLASALRLRGDDVRVTFCCHDARLVAAARSEGFEVVP